MNFDYDLVDRIGATHYFKKPAGGHIYYKCAGFVYVYCDAIDTWAEVSQRDSAWCVENLKPIPPRPHSEYRYERVTDKGFWGLREEFEAGELYEIVDAKYKFKMVSIKSLAAAYARNAIYRRVTVERDWRDVVVKQLPEDWDLGRL